MSDRGMGDTVIPDRRGLAHRVLASLVGEQWDGWSSVLPVESATF